jgi:hypothetical protein
MTGVLAELHDFVVRAGGQELWLTDVWTHEVVRLDLVAHRGTSVRMPGAIRHVNIRPAADQLIATAFAEAALWRVDLATRAVDGAKISLPDPFGSSADFELGSSGLRVAGRIARVPAQSSFDPAFGRE